MALFVTDLPFGCTSKWYFPRGWWRVYLSELYHFVTLRVVATEQRTQLFQQRCVRWCLPFTARTHTHNKQQQNDKDAAQSSARSAFNHRVMVWVCSHLSSEEICGFVVRFRILTGQLFRCTYQGVPQRAHKGISYLIIINLISLRRVAR